MKDLFDVLKPGSKDWALANTIDPNRMPAHIAIIMDGNGRWAKKRNLPPPAPFEPPQQFLDFVALLDPLASLAPATGGT